MPLSELVREGAVRTPFGLCIRPECRVDVPPALQSIILVTRTVIWTNGISPGLLPRKISLGGLVNALTLGLEPIKLGSMK
jgi:hypothetical protein